MRPDAKRHFPSIRSSGRGASGPPDTDRCCVFHAPRGPRQTRHSAIFELISRKSFDARKIITRPCGDSEVDCSSGPICPCTNYILRLPALSVRESVPFLIREIFLFPLVYFCPPLFSSASRPNISIFYYFVARP